MFALLIALAPPILQTCLAILLVRRGLHRQFRYFFAYTVYAVAAESLRLSMLKAGWTYFYIYWTTEVLYVILGFLAIHEVFHSIFRNFYGIRGIRLLFPWVATLMLVASLIRGLTLNGNELVRYLGVIIALKIGVGFLQVGMFFLFILLVRLFRVQSRRYAFGIALGYGISAAGDLSFYLLRSEFGTKFDRVVVTAVPIVYIIAVMVWLLAFIKPQPPHPWQDGGSALDPEELISELRRYTAVAKGVLRR